MAALVALCLAGCPSPPRQRVDELPDMPYPTCSEGSAAPQVLAQGTLRAGPVMREQGVVERFTLEQRGCLRVMTVRQTWELSLTDVEIVYDERLQPLRAWQRMIVPGPQEIERRIDTRLFDLSGERASHLRQRPTGEYDRFMLRGQRPAAIIGPGRGLLTAWLQRVRLAVGGRVREPVLDMRESMEVIRDVSLQRLEDRDDALLGHVRVYTIYGREPFYANDDDVVVGDMMGLVRADALTTPMPPVIDEGPPPDPRASF